MTNVSKAQRIARTINKTDSRKAKAKKVHAWALAIKEALKNG